MRLAMVRGVSRRVPRGDRDATGRRAPPTAGRLARAAAAADARARAEISSIYRAHLPQAYPIFTRYHAESPRVDLYRQLIADIRLADLFPVPDEIGLAARASDDGQQHRIDQIAGYVVDPSAPPLTPPITPEWTRTIPTDGVGAHYRRDPSRSSEGEDLLLLLAAPTYDDQPARPPIHAPLDPRIALDGTGRRRLQRQLAVILRYAERREPTQWAYDADPLERSLLWSNGTFAGLPPPLPDLACAAGMMNRSTGEPYLDAEEAGGEIFEDLPWSVASVAELSSLWARARPYRVRALAALDTLRDPATFTPLVGALYRAVRAAELGDVATPTAPPPLWQTLGMDGPDPAGVAP